MNGPRSWNEAVVANGMRHNVVMSVCFRGAPYGYRYVSKHDGDGQARFDVILEEARVVRQVFTWVGQDRCSIGEVCRRLNSAKEKTRTGKTVWDRATMWDMLKNPAYKGAAAFGKTSV